MDVPVRPRNPGTPLDLDRVREVRINRSAVERRAATLRAPAARSRRSGRPPGCCAPSPAWTSPPSPATTRPGGCAGSAPRRGSRCARISLEALGVGAAPLTVGAVCVYHAFVATAVGRSRARHPGRRGLDRLSGGPHARCRSASPRSARRWRRAREEIDIVITRAHVLTGNWRALYDEVRAFREACGEAHIKAILATGELGTLRNVARREHGGMMAGADFIKTSTGKESVNATLPVRAGHGARDPRLPRAHRPLVGFKPAGGIRTAKDALDWLDPDEGGAGRPLAAARPVPLRRERAADRHRAAARALRDRALLPRRTATPLCA